MANMTGKRELVLRAIEAARIDRPMTAWLAGRGVVFVLHRVAAPGSPIVDPDMTVTTDVLDDALRTVRRMGCECITVDEVARRLNGPMSGRPFVCFTFDDGYRDNLEQALPVFARHGVPMCVYVTTGLIDGGVDYWWGGLMRVIERNDSVNLSVIGVHREIPTRAIEEKRDAFEVVQTWVHADLEKRSTAVLELCTQYGVDPQCVREADALTWDEVKLLAENPLVTIGAHGVTHRRLSRLSPQDMRHELLNSRTRLEGVIGRPVRHLAYPYGGPAACGGREFAAAKAAGYETAVTSREGNIFRRHKESATSLPRQRLVSMATQRHVERCVRGTQWLMRRGPIVVGAS